MYYKLKLHSLMYVSIQNGTLEILLYILYFIYYYTYIIIPIPYNFSDMYIQLNYRPREREIFPYLFYYQTKAKHYQINKNSVHVNVYSENIRFLVILIYDE